MPSRDTRHLAPALSSRANGSRGRSIPESRARLLHARPPRRLPFAPGRRTRRVSRARGRLRGRYALYSWSSHPRLFITLSPAARVWSAWELGVVELGIGSEVN